MSTDIKKKTLEDVARAAKAVVGLAEKKEDAPKQSGFVEYIGGDAQLDRAIAGYSEKYAQGREKALSGDPQGLAEMRQANDSANQLRNAKGYAAQFADQDIAYVKGQMGESRESGKASAATGGSRGSSSQSGAGGASAPKVNDYSDYIQAMAQAKREAAVSQLQAAYEKNLAQLDRAKEEIAPAYEAARNRAAGQAAQSRRQFNEYAAAHGLGSGLGGQAQLALSNHLQGTLGDLSAREADAVSKLELERAQAEADYNAALAKARSEEDYELARQLYDEKVRQDEALAQWTKWQAQQDYQSSYFDWQRQQAQRNAEREDALAEAGASGESEEQLREMLFQYAQSTGDYGSLEAYYTPQQIARLEEQWRAQRAQADREEQTQEQDQARKEAEWAAKYGDYAALKALGVDTGYLERTQAAQLAQLAAKGTAAKSASAAKSTGYKPKFTVSQVDKAIDNGRITDQVKRDFQYYYGVDYDAFFETGEGDTARKPAVSEANFAIALNTLTAMMRDGDYDMAQRGVAGLEGRLTPDQKEQLDELMAELEEKYPKKRLSGTAVR